jgi:hypothetical protein
VIPRVLLFTYDCDKLINNKNLLLLFVFVTSFQSPEELNPLLTMIQVVVCHVTEYLRIKKVKVNILPIFFSEFLWSRESKMSIANRIVSEATTMFLETMLQPDILSYIQKGEGKKIFFIKVYEELKRKGFPLDVRSSEEGKSFFTSTIF